MKKLPLYAALAVALGCASARAAAILAARLATMAQAAVVVVTEQPAVAQAVLAARALSK